MHKRRRLSEAVPGLVLASCIYKTVATSKSLAGGGIYRSFTTLAI